MEDAYQYPVFFECHGPLLRGQRRAIERHFSLSRRSGGGDCGPLSSVRDQVFSVAFRSQRDQQRVLQRPEHVVTFADGTLVLVVRGSLESDAAPPIAASSPGPDSTSPVQKSLQSIPASIPPPSGEECELRPDTYRLPYPQAGKEPERKPASRDCTAQRFKTRICRLGQAKLRLLWREIEEGLGQRFPGVKVTRRDAGQVALEGSLKDVVKAGDWISDKENLVLERRVSNMSPHLLAFVRKAYGGPGALRDFLGVGDEVEIELGDIELRFLSLSPDKLDDPANKMQEKFKEIKIDLPNSSAVPSELREKLKSKTTEMNQGQLRAQFLFGSDSTVYLLGHTREFEELNETVKQCFLQNAINLPFPELAHELQVFLQLHGFDLSEVTFHLLTLSSGCMLVLEGPNSKVTQVRNLLGPFLDSLVQDTTDLMASLNLSEGNQTVASSSLCDGLQVLVCQGDLSKQDTDALVDAAREDLENSCDVAAAMGKTGGPEGQRERDILVKQAWKVPSGDVEATTGWNLHFAGGRERSLLENTVQFTLNVAERMELRSVAIPCISSGLFGVPVNVCSEAIVTAVKEFCTQGGRSLSTVILIDNRAEGVRALQEACDRLFQGISTGNSPPRDLRSQTDAAGGDTTRGATAGAPGDNVHFEAVQGTIETQQVDALVSPMVGHDPLSTLVGYTLSNTIGSQSDLIPRFINESGEESMPGDEVLVEDVTGLPSKAVFFLNLVPWDDDEDGTAVQVLRLGINNVLTSCEKRGFGSVALPVLGAGSALRFPHSVIARVLLEEVHSFKQNRASRTPLLVRITIYPTDTEATEVFKGFIKDLHQPDEATGTMRIVLLGKTGSGKSALANSLFGAEELFRTSSSSSSGTSKCQAETRPVNGRSITLIDTPGLFDTDRSEVDMRTEITRCLVELAPGPHAFLIVLKVERFTEQEQATIVKILQYFSEDALKYAVIVFTHGKQLVEGQRIQEFVSQNRDLSDLVAMCGGRCHVFDNRYWNNKQKNDYRSNQFQAEELLNTIDKMVMENNGGYYTNNTLQDVSEEIKMEEQRIQLSSVNISKDVVRQRAKTNVHERLLIRLTGLLAGAILGAIFGAAVTVGVDITSVKDCSELHKLKIPTLAKGVLSAVGGRVLGLGTAAVMTAGGVAGGAVGYDAVKGANTPQEAAVMALNAVIDKSKVLKLK